MFISSTESNICIYQYVTLSIYIYILQTCLHLLPELELKEKKNKNAVTGIADIEAIVGKSKK